MSTGEADIVCITQTTLIIINNVNLLINNCRFVFFRFELSFDLLARVNGGQYKTRTADYGTTDYGLGIKHGLRYKIRTKTADWV